MCLISHRSIYECLLITIKYLSVWLRFIYFLGSGIIELRNSTRLRVEITYICWIVLFYLYLWKIRLGRLVIKCVTWKSSDLVWTLRLYIAFSWICKLILIMIVSIYWIILIYLIRYSILMMLHLSIRGIWWVVCSIWRCVKLLKLLKLSILIIFDRNLWRIIIS